MSQWPAKDLRRANGLYPHHADAPCAGCGQPLADEDECYATWDHIWHYTCWPKVRSEDEG